jgi:hypothetical protein
MANAFYTVSTLKSQIGPHQAFVTIDDVARRCEFRMKKRYYAPALNPVERLWDDLREKFFHNRVFASLEALEDPLVSGLLAYENDPARVKSITVWDWIIRAL